MALIYRSWTHVLRQGFFEVQNQVGVGRDEEDYHQALKLWLTAKGIPFTSKSPHAVMFAGRVAHTLFPDFVVWNEITIELKSVPRRPASSEFVQLFDYLKNRNDRLGLLVNMGLYRVHVNRILFQDNPARLEQDWRYWRHIDGRSKEVGHRTSRLLKIIYDEHGSGYGSEVIRKLILCALRCDHLSVQEFPVAPARYDTVELRSSRLDCIVIEGTVVLTYTALFDTNDFNIQRGLSYLRALGLTWGVAANFGKSAVQLVGLSRRT